MKEEYSVPLTKKGGNWAFRLVWIREQQEKNGMKVRIYNDRYWFENESDLLLYLLRWGY